MNCHHLQLQREICHLHLIHPHHGHHHNQHRHLELQVEEFSVTFSASTSSTPTMATMATLKLIRQKQTFIIPKQPIQARTYRHRNFILLVSLSLFSKLFSHNFHFPKSDFHTTFTFLNVIFTRLPSAVVNSSFLSLDTDIKSRVSRRQSLQCINSHMYVYGFSRNRNYLKLSRS